MKKIIFCWLILGNLFSNTLNIAAPQAEIETYSVVVLGGGVGALTSALYLARAGHRPLVIEGGAPGGLLTQSHSVQNWPGELEIEGQVLTDKIRSHAQASGAVLIEEEVVAVDFSKRPFELKTRSVQKKGFSRTIFADSCIIAMGTTPNFLGVAGEKEYWGQGVTNCAICDGSLYQDQIVAVVGGGDAAVLEAMYLAKIAKQVHIFVRKDELRANEVKRIALLLEQPNVAIHYQTEIEAILGDGERVTGALLKKANLEQETIALNGVFLAIGSKPNSELFQGALKLDEKGYIILEKDQETSIPGVYAVGDIVDPIYKQAISASGDGAKAALQAQQFLMDRSEPIVRLKKGQKKFSHSVENNVIEIASKSHFEKELKESRCTVVVDFYATWCGPCKRIASLIEATAARLVGKVRFLKVNVDQVRDLSQFYHIRAMPTVLVFNSEGMVVDRKIGTDEIASLLEQIVLKQRPLKNSSENEGDSPLRY